MKSLKILSALSISIFLNACTPPPAPTDPAADVAQWIDPAITDPATRSLLAEGIRLLPVDYRSFVTIVNMRDNSVLSNKPSPVVAFNQQPIYRASVENGGVYAQGATMPDCRTYKTGVMHRSVTVPGSFLGFSSTVQLPTQITQNESVSPHDTAYLYLGGFGDDIPSSTKGRQLEAGLKFNMGTNNSNNDWTVYMRTENGGADLLGIYGQRYAYQKGATVKLNLVLLGVGTPKQMAALLTYDLNSNVKRSYMIELSAANKLEGWRLPMSSIRFYRASSIGQAQNDVVASGTTADFIKTGAWYQNAKWFNGQLADASGVYRSLTFNDLVPNCSVPQDTRYINTVIAPGSPDVTVSISTSARW